MAFWDNWFKVECESCNEKFKKEELIEYEEQSVCSDCRDELEAQAAVHAKEVEERRLAEEAARAALLDRPIETSGKPFGATYDSGDGNSRF